MCFDITQIIITLKPIRVIKQGIVVDVCPKGKGVLELPLNYTQWVGS